MSKLSEGAGRHAAMMIGSFFAGIVVRCAAALNKPHKKQGYSSLSEILQIFSIHNKRLCNNEYF